MATISVGSKVRIKGESLRGDLRQYADKVAKVTKVHDNGKLRLDIDSGANFWEADKLTLISTACIPITSHDLDWWISTNQNVLMVGLHGIGKTAKIVEAFQRNNLNWKYFSASTMDPWVDFIGIPRSKTDANGNEYLDLLRPKEFEEDQVEALFFDEFNRAVKKVVNGVMELIQFGSINGRKFKKLRFVWAAINPEDDDDLEFSVESLDPAQRDRFQVQVILPYEPSREYFSKKYDEDSAKHAIAWWNGLPYETQLKVSPRRLDYAMDVFHKGGNVRFVLPVEANPTAFLKAMEDAAQRGDYAELLQAFNDNKPEKAKEILLRPNTYASFINHVITPVFSGDYDGRSVKVETKLARFALPLLTDEQVTSLMYQYPKLVNTVMEMYRDGSFEDLVIALKTAGRFTDQITSAEAMKKISDNKDIKAKGNEAVVLDALTRLGRVGMSDLLKDLSSNYHGWFNMGKLKGTLGSLCDKKLVIKHGARGRGVTYEAAVRTG